MHPMAPFTLVQGHLHSEVFGLAWQNHSRVHNGQSTKVHLYTHWRSKREKSEARVRAISYSNFNTSEP